MKKLILSLSILSSSFALAGIPAGYSLKSVPLPKGAATVLGVCSKNKDTIAIATWEGQIWEYTNGKWSLFAEDLMEPNGIYYSKDEDCYYVAQKPEITRLVDLDKDGKCDLYQNRSSGFGWGGTFHEYHYGPVADSLGRLYTSLNLAANKGFNVPDGKDRKTPGAGGNMGSTAAYRGWVMRSDRQGHLTPFASGFRSPAGIGMSPNDELFVTDNQGDWFGACPLIHVREGGFYGHPASLPDRPDFTQEKVRSMTAADFDKIRSKPAVWFPREVISKSPGSPVWDTTDGKFGPFKGQIFIGDQSVSNYFRCGLEMIDGDYQGFCINFLDKTESGTVKMAFDTEGRLWSAQVGRGWLSQGGKRTALQYAEWDGKTIPFEILDINLTETGFKVTFTQPIGEMLTPKVETHHYHYWSMYGSDEIDREEVSVSNYKLSKDRKTIRFDVPLTTDKVYTIDFSGQRNTKNTALVNHTAYYTLNKILPKKKVRKGRDRGFKLVGTGWSANDKNRPKPSVVAPLSADDCKIELPDGAIPLGADQWNNPAWKFDSDGVFARSKGNNATKDAYGSSQIHIEFRIDPSDDPQWIGQLYGNSGIFLMSGYELQVMNSYKNDTTADGMCGAFWGQIPPRVNVSRPPGEWQSYDILMKQPEFAKDGSLTEPLRATIFHNGVLIHDDVMLYGEVGKPYKKHGQRPLMIQDHKGTGVSFRNAWIKPEANYDNALHSFRNTFPKSH